MKEPILVFEVECWEANIILNALNEFKHQANDIDEKSIISKLILKVIDAPEKKIPFSKLKKEFDER